MIKIFKAIVIALLATTCARPDIIKQDVTPVIGLQPFEGFEKALMDSISVALKSIYGYHVVMLDEQPLPPNAFVRIKTPRYRADSLLRHLLRIKPDSIDYIMGLTTKDISTTKKDQHGHIKQPESKYRDWGIFGLGYLPGNSCVISTYRIYDSDYAKFIDRLNKVCVHELGHNLGLSHCETEGCVMQDAAETIRTTDAINLDLCSRCKRKLKMIP